MNFLKSKFFLVLVIVTMILVLVPAILSMMGLTSPVRAAVNTVLTPVQKLFHAVADAVEGFGSYFTKFDRLMKENEDLRRENEALKEQIYQADELSDINEWLYSYLELKREHTDFQFLRAEITGRNSNSAVTLFTLDKGTSAGVEKQMPVLTSDGIIGFVSEVGLNWCKVQTLIESSSAIGVYDERSGAVGILEGDYNLGKQRLCRLSYLEENADVSVGDRILSSGYGTMYPRDLIVGYVVSVESDPYSRAPVAYVRLAADASSLDAVMILTGYEKKLDP